MNGTSNEKKLQKFKGTDLTQATILQLNFTYFPPNETLVSNGPFPVHEHSFYGPFFHSSYFL